MRTPENSYGNIALKNVSRRIKLIFDDEYGLQIYSTIEIGTNVHLVLLKIGIILRFYEIIVVHETACLIMEKGN